MNKYKENFGVDISKDVFDVHGSKAGHHQYKNDESGFKKFLKRLPDDCLVAMETRGYYHYRFAQFLYKTKNIKSELKLLLVISFFSLLPTYLCMISCVF